VLFDETLGRLVHHKEPSTPQSPEEAVGRGIAALLASASATAGEIALVVHGTTISLNALIQRKGARVAVVVSPGNRDLLEIGRLKLANSFDFFIQPEDRLATRDRVLEIAARIDADGTESQIPTAEDFDRAAKHLETLDAVAVAVVLINAHLTPAAEHRVAAEIGRRLPRLPVVASTEIWPDIREYERGIIAVMNAYVTPIMDRYYRRLLDVFGASGITAPVLITANNGGTIDIATARGRPIETMLSGPAAGVVAAIKTARQAGIAGIVTFDMGGTSADIAIAEGDTPEITTRTLIGELPLILPVVNVTAIGAGGGSIVRVDSEGILKVGPRSAGADPGPVCYARGGADLTITDCYLTCGFLDPHAFLGGRLSLSETAVYPVVDRIAAAMGLAGDERKVRAAEAAIRVASSMMGSEIRKLLARRGCDPRAFTLLPYGGAGPTHAAMVAEEAGIDSILVAAAPGTLCALGGVLANLRRDFVRSCKILLHAEGVAPSSTLLADILSGLIIEAEAWTAGLSGMANGWRFEVSADMRYPDQAFDLSIRLADFDRDTDVGPLLARRFHAEHQRLYEFNEPESGIALNRIVLSAVGLQSGPPVPPAMSRQDAEPRYHPAFMDGAWRSVRRLHRSALATGACLAGPLIVEQPDTTVVVPPSWRLEALESGSLKLTRDAAGGAI
jgi:N-methylhydantoinase A